MSDFTSQEHGNVHPAAYEPLTQSSNDVILESGGTSHGKKDVEEAALEVQSTSNARTWKPFYFRHIYLLGSALLYCMMIVILEVLYYLSERNHGLATVSQSRHYLWTYGPTLVLTIVAAYWGQLEYRTLQLMPWIVMKRGPAGPKDSIILNYTSPNTISSLVKSAKAGHTPVTLTILGSLLLRGLLSLQPQTMDDQTRLHTLNKFAFDTDNSEAIYNANLDNTLWAIKSYNASYPTWTSEKYAVQQFASSESLPNGTLSGVVEVFDGDLIGCETFTWENTSDWRVLNIRSDSCVVGNITISTGVSTVWTGEIMSVNCTNLKSADAPERVLIYLGFYAETTNRLLGNLSGIICEPSYSLTRRTVWIPSQGLQSGMQAIVAENVSENLSIAASSDSITNLLVSLSQDDIMLMTLDNYTSSASTWFSLLNTTAPQATMAGFSDSDTLTMASRTIFRALSALLMSPWQTVTDQTTFYGDFTHIENRLFVEELSLRLMEGILAPLVCISILLSLTRRFTALQDMGTLAAHAIMLLKSPDLAGDLESTETLSEKSLQAYFSRKSFFTTQAGGITSVVSVESAVPATTSYQPISHDNIEREWYRPISLSWPFRIATVIIPSATVVVLEIMYQYSESHQGIAYVNNDDYMRYFWLYITATLMTVIGLTFQALNSAARVLDPYLQLKKGTLSTKAMFKDPVGKVSGFAFFEAILERRLAVACTITATIIASILTIVTSGLYTSQLIPQTTTIPVQLQGWFNISTTTSSNANLESDIDKAADISSLIQFNNLSFPQWTYNELALPIIQTTSELAYSSLDQSPTTLSARLPALRAQMNCTVLNTYTNTDFMQPEAYDAAGATVTIIIDAPAGYNAHFANGSLIHQVHLAGLSFGVVPEPDSITYDFAMQIFAFSPSEAPFAQDSYAREYLWYMVGSQTGNLTNEVELIYCAPFLEAVVVNATFSLSDYSLLSEPTVVADAPTLEVSNSSVALYPSLAISTSANASFAPPVLDAFFTALVTGYEGVPVQELVGFSNKDTLLAKMERLYRQLVAQNLNSATRTSDLAGIVDSRSDVPRLGNFLTSVAPNGVCNGTVSAADEYRLVQSAVSTRILEGALAVMAVCAAISWVCMRDTKVLKRDPGSIVGKMALFAGSEFLTRLRIAVEEDGNGVLGEDGFERVLRESALRLGWWSGSEGSGEGEVAERRERYGIDIDNNRI